MHPLKRSFVRNPLQITAALAFSTIAASASAALYSPRILSPHNADTYSLKTFAQFHRWRDLEPNSKMFEIFQYLTDPRTGIYPLGVPAIEGNEELTEFGAVTDPVKMLNVYPIGHCGTLGPTAAAIMEGAGIGPGRTLIIPGWHHVAAETFFAGHWHYLDLDVRAAFRRDNGALASIEEARTDPTLWLPTNHARFFPLDNLPSVHQAYKAQPIQHRYNVAQGGHTMDFVLRQGESLTRWWTPQDGRWNHHSSYAEKPFPRNTIERPPRGPKCKHPSFTLHSHGNGRFVYKPNLTSAYTDFDDGAYTADNVTTSPAGLTLRTPNNGFAIFEIHSPYVIVPRVGDLDTPNDDREASVVKIDASNVSLALSLDHGHTWLPLPSDKPIIDLTPHVAGRYQYLLKLNLNGKPHQTTLRSLEITTWVQLHPASLPSLRAGINKMRFVTGDHYGLPTRLLALCPNPANRPDFLQSLTEPPADYDPTRKTSRIHGSFIAKVIPPPHTQIAWFSAGASFATSVGATQNTRNSIAFATNDSTHFTNLYQAQVPPDQTHWHYNIDREIKLEQPARQLFLRYHGQPAVNAIRIFAHCIDLTPKNSAPILIRHAWLENGLPKSKEIQLNSPAQYNLNTGPNPVDDFIQIAVPSQPR